MSQALYTSMSGINAGTTDLQVIANNVANINTTAFKASRVNFADVYSTTLSYGSVASGTSGGTNPIQIGVGVKTSSISKDFSSGSVNTTGNDTDLMIQGNGFFAVKSPDNQIFYTRAGDFTWDNKGNLVTSAGYKVMGTNNIFSTSTSGSTVYVPKSIISVVEGNANMGNVKVSDLNGLDSNITKGTFTLTTEGAAAGTTVITLSDADLSGDVNTLITAINGQLTGTGVTASVTNGKINFEVDNADATSITFGKTSDTSNFLTATALSNSTKSGDTYSSKVLDYSCTVTDVTSAAAATGINSTAINSDGSIQATYQNGDTLSVKLGADNATYEFVYTTEDGIQISGESLNVSGNVAVPANFVIQTATVTNEEGLLSVGSNMFKAGPNSGTITYTVGNNMGCGAIASGCLEASNVDLSEELSNMILAQRAVQANSRVFSTTSNIMDTINNMGR